MNQLYVLLVGFVIKCQMHIYVHSGGMIYGRKFTLIHTACRVDLMKYLLVND